MDIGAVVHPWDHDTNDCWLYGIMVALGLRHRVGIEHGHSVGGCVSDHWGCFALLGVSHLVGLFGCTLCLVDWGVPGCCGTSNNRRWVALDASSREFLG